MHERLQGRGVGAGLLAAAEQHIRETGRPSAQLSVEDDNPRARTLYERLGYQPVGTEVDEWEVRLADGTIGRHTAHCTVMRKHL